MVTDLAAVLGRLARPDWYYRPFSETEIAEHPDADRLFATLEAVVAEVARLEDGTPKPTSSSSSGAPTGRGGHEPSSA